MAHRLRRRAAPRIRLRSQEGAPELPTPPKVIHSALSRPLSFVPSEFPHHAAGAAARGYDRFSRVTRPSPREFPPTRQDLRDLAAAVLRDATRKRLDRIDHSMRTRPADLVELASTLSSWRAPRPPRIKHISAGSMQSRAMGRSQPAGDCGWTAIDQRRAGIINPTLSGLLAPHLDDRGAAMGSGRRSMSGSRHQ